MISEETLKNLAEILAKHFSSYPHNESEIKACIPAVKSLLASGEVVLKNDVQELVEAAEDTLVIGCPVFGDKFPRERKNKRLQQALAKFKWVSHAG